MDDYNEKTLQNAIYFIIFVSSVIIGGTNMAIAVRISNRLVQEAKVLSKIENRSITGQIEHWARIGKCAEENPDMPYNLIKEILLGIEELEQGKYSEYILG